METRPSRAAFFLRSGSALCRVGDGEGSQPALEGVESGASLRGELLRKWCGVAEFVGGDVGKDEPVVPLAAGLLEAFEAVGEAVGGGGRSGGGLGEVAGELGALADFVECGSVCGA